MKRIRLDWMVALAFAVLAQIELWLGDEPDEPLLAIVALMFTVPLAWRRTRPFAALLVALLGLAVLTLEGTDYFTTAQFVALLWATYSLGAHAELPAAVTGIALACASAVLNTLRVGAADAGDYVFPSLLLTGPWLAGRGLRVWRMRALELEALNRALEDQREQLARLAVADERARISRELHDAVAHSINVTIIQAEAAEEVLARRPDDARAPLRSIQASGREALTEMRRLLGMLREDGRDGVQAPPRLGDLETLVQNVRDAGLEVELTIRGERTRLAPGVELSAYRIVQEALTNTLKHARATRAEVVLDYRDEMLALEVSDDGALPSPPRDGVGHGLIGMRERAALFGGDVAAGRREEGGFCVRARLPLDR